MVLAFDSMTGTWCYTAVAAMYSCVNSEGEPSNISYEEALNTVLNLAGEECLAEVSQGALPTTSPQFKALSSLEGFIRRHGESIEETLDVPERFEVAVQSDEASALAAPQSTVNALCICLALARRQLLAPSHQSDNRAYLVSALDLFAFLHVLIRDNELALDDNDELSECPGLCAKLSF